MAEDHPTPRDDQPSRWSSVLRRPVRARHAAWPAVAGAVLVGYAWVDATAAPFTTLAFVGVVIPGLVLAGIAYGRPPERVPPPDGLDVLGMSYWVICLAALFEWEASSFRDNSWPWHPSLTNLINPLLAPHPVKSAAIVAWILAGLGTGETVSPIPTRAVTIIGFAVIIAAMVALEFLGRRPGSRIPTAGQWLGYAMRTRTGRVLVLAGWWWLGWHYFAR